MTSEEGVFVILSSSDYLIGRTVIIELEVIPQFGALASSRAFFLLHQ